jgi:hypothetical protein
MGCLVVYGAARPSFGPSADVTFRAIREAGWTLADQHRLDPLDLRIMRASVQ